MKIKQNFNAEKYLKYENKEKYLKYENKAHLGKNDTWLFLRSKHFSNKMIVKL